MPEFQAVQCYKCRTFQVQQVSKALRAANKFGCRMCGEKQSIRKVYAVGAAKDVRAVVVRLSSIQGQQQTLASPPDASSSHDAAGRPAEAAAAFSREAWQAAKGSGALDWSQFLDPGDLLSEQGAADRELQAAEQDAQEPGSARYVTALPERSRKRARRGVNGAPEGGSGDREVNTASLRAPRGPIGAGLRGLVSAARGTVATPAATHTRALGQLCSRDPGAGRGMGRPLSECHRPVAASSAPRQPLGPHQSPRHQSESRRELQDMAPSSWAGKPQVATSGQAPWWEEFVEVYGAAEGASTAAQPFGPTSCWEPSGPVCANSRWDEAPSAPFRAVGSGEFTTRVD